MAQITLFLSENISYLAAVGKAQFQLYITFSMESEIKYSSNKRNILKCRMS